MIDLINFSMRLSLTMTKIYIVYILVDAWIIANAPLIGDDEEL